MKDLILFPGGERLLPDLLLRQWEENTAPDAITVEGTVQLFAAAVADDIVELRDARGRTLRTAPSPHSHTADEITDLEVPRDISDLTDENGLLENSSGAAARRNVPFTAADLADGVLTRSAAQLGAAAASPVAVFDDQGYDVSSDSRITIRWHNDTLTVDLSAVGTISGTWMLRFAGGTALETRVLDRIANAYAVPLVELDGVPCHYLDGTYNEMRLADFVRNVSTLKFYIRSASDSVTGNVVLTPSVGGVPRDAVVIPVTATDASQVITFDPPATGMITITRDTGDERDTLKDTDPVTAVIGTDLQIEVV